MRRVTKATRQPRHRQRKAWGFFGRLFGRGEHEPRGRCPRPTSAHLDLGDIQGFILRGYRMPMVRHFLLTVGVPAAARKLLGRLVSGNESDAPQITTAEDWHVGFAPGPGDNPADTSTPQARLLPERGHHLARTDRAGDQGSRPDDVVQVVRRVHGRGRRTSEIGGRYRSQVHRRTGSASLGREAITSW